MGRFIVMICGQDLRIFGFSLNVWIWPSKMEDMEPGYTGNHKSLWETKGVGSVIQLLKGESLLVRGSRHYPKCFLSYSESGQLEQSVMCTGEKGRG